MKLISCSIENFGKLNKKFFKFDSNLTVLNEDNSFGKTTLANFIVSMFYGLPNLKGKSVGSNERRLYDPWQGGVFGGMLTFELGKNQYSIERDFNKKNDEFRFLDVATKKSVSKINGVTVDSTNLGEVLFGINKDSYRRSAYVPQEEITFSELDGGLNDKLRNLINATSEAHNLDKSLKVLDVAASTIEAKRGGGKLQQAVSALEQLDKKIDYAKACIESSGADSLQLGKLNAELAKVEDEIARCEVQIKLASEKAGTTAEQSHYKSLMGAVVVCEEKITQLKDFFVSGRMVDVNLAELKKSVDAIEAKKAVVADVKLEEAQALSSVESVKSANSVRAQNKDLLLSQYQALSTTKKSLKREVRELEGAKSLGLLGVILCIITFGVYYIAVHKGRIKGVDAKISQKEAHIELLDKQLEQLSMDINRAELTSVADLEDGVAKIKARLAKEESELQRLCDALDSVLVQFNYTESSYALCLAEIKNVYASLEEESRRLRDAKKRLEEFLVGKDIAQLQGSKAANEESKFSLEELQGLKRPRDARRLELIEQIATLKGKIECGEEHTGELANLESERAVIIALKSELEEKFKLINLTKDFLQTANDNLASQYLAPLRDKTRALLKAYGKGDNDFDVDADAKILIAEAGRDRELDYFSKGIKELVSICTRFAMVNIIFGTGKGIKPPIILDDPFVNLDDKKIKQAKAFVKHLSKDYQILYLTCSESRVV